MTEKTPPTTKDAPKTKDADALPTIEFPEVLGNGWHPYRESYAVYASHVDTGFAYDGKDYADGAWLVRDTEGKDSVVDDDEFNATYISIPPAKMDTDTQTALSAVATL